jgi:hypothetical protein
MDLGLPCASNKFDVRKATDGCAPTLNRNFFVLIALYLNQNMNDQGFPSIEKRNCGSKAKRLLPTDKSKIKAGLPKVNIGNNEMPLLVADAAPEMWYVLSVFCAFEMKMVSNSNKVILCIIVLDHMQDK